MTIKQIEIRIGGLLHTVQVNDADPYPLRDGLQSRAKEPENKARTPKNKAAKPAGKKPDPKVEAASDPDASE